MLQIWLKQYGMSRTMTKRLKDWDSNKTSRQNAKIIGVRHDYARRLAKKYGLKYVVLNGRPRKG